ncbi:MAG TPA: FAD-dependent tricarballylate dehydrogenase TcuA [Rhodopseudomonas sp.]|uniref:FAD-dependent tricarballylate dehydrogenase TcuA n=1 Tax=Rhodopseudomonas sp. TaxID=1078 RepID=UPI002ED96D5C
MSGASAPTAIDVLVVGGGSAALCAALAARRRGATVRLLEQAPISFRGGNSRHARNFRLMHDEAQWYVPDSYGEAAFLRDLHRVTAGATDEALARLLIRGSASIAPWLQDNGVALQDPGSGVMPHSKRTAFFLGGGKAMINALYATAEAIGVEIGYDSEVVALHVEDARCSEVVVARDGGAERIAAKAVVLACGGQQSDRGWLRAHFGAIADGLVIRGTPYVTGRVLRLLLDAGARAVGDPAQAHIVAVDARGPEVDGGIVTRITAIPYGIVVDRNAKRFHDEGEDARKTHYARWGARIAQCERQTAYLIMDAAGRARALPTALPPIEADSIAGLAAKLELDPQALQATVASFNAAVREGGGTEALTPPKSHGAKPLTAPPFAAYPMRPGLTFTHFGVAVDQTMRVLTTGDECLGNVFAAGMIMAANVLGRGYLAGLGVTLSAVFGRLAGEEAARHAAR